MSATRRKKLEAYLEQRSGGFALISAMADELRAMWPVLDAAKARREVDEGRATLHPGKGYVDIVRDLNAALDAYDEGQ